MIANEAIAKAVAEAMKAAVKAMAAVTTERPHSITGLKLAGPTMKQPSFK